MSTLIGQGYVSHDLRAIEKRHIEKTGLPAVAFVKREQWGVMGPSEYQERIINSPFTGANYVLVPTNMTFNQVQNYEAERLERRARSMMLAVTQKPEEKIERIFKNCVICGKRYEETPFYLGPTCKSETCQKEFVEAVNKKRSLSTFNSHKPQPQPAPKPRTPKPINIEVEQGGDIYTPNFSLDDPDNKSRTGYVYLIESENGLYKIGRSHDVFDRYATLEAIIPTDIKLIHAFYCNNYVNSETYLHRLYGPKHDHGEWFRLDPNDVQFVAGLSDGALDRV